MRNRTPRVRKLRLAKIIVHAWIATTSSEVLLLSTAHRRHTNPGVAAEASETLAHAPWQHTVVNNISGLHAQDARQGANTQQAALQKGRRLFVLGGREVSQKAALLSEMVATAASSVARLGVLWAMWPARVRRPLWA